ncbi:MULTISPECIES: TonB-dependent receptor domain-containing protein [unclassified Brevundimonas]|uniref:TonB-dependent receptor domain-containing protein n=1 Tax=unclassified Brevundimonas TaxID=2622653 RepID=UPI000CFE2085|nr:MULTISPECIES: TonB-dependent receptor [unclassified Brevundimonas]PRA28031.1 TonB-dependent receptor [Brevundimonas sp. MYb27]PQZ84772.1 TonB-dependent receptor [Brevundimonas sp. MYb31]PRB14638.1 TonB-dependent receptor [Brevundimonas sp. MYb52]PRB36591.1 TonB-dependent receptor [Brevundimonas sp. MYb46]PRB55712.1 TonB-dependent receptor [Brevundimonas sp. MYb33]
MKMHSKIALMATTASAVLFAGMAQAQEASSVSVGEQASQVEDVVVVGTNIRGARTTAALPVIVADREQIEATGATTGDELLRTIPQMGDVLFDSANNPQTSNSARGDVNSVNLRSLGVGNTLVLLNGRRLVQHPTSQGTSDTGTVPVLSYNSNAIPVSGLERLEVLLDGAAAIYGADAVAGVVNTVLRDNIDGLTVSARYGGAEGTQMRDTEFNLFAGKNLERGNVSLFANYAQRTALWASDQDFTRSDDIRPLFADYADFAGVQSLDGRSSHTPWARLSVGSRAVIRSNGTAVTNSAGAFRFQPSSFGCGVDVGGDICLSSGNHNFNTTNRDMRYDTRHETTVRPSVERLNLFLTGRYDLTDNVEAFGEIGYYSAHSRAVQPPVVNLNQIWIPASNYYNPFGPVTFADGSANPNRLPGLTGVPAAGLPVLMTNYRFVDTGFQVVKVDNYQARLMGGLRGEWRGFDWETALVYSEAEAEDRSPNINMTALQKQLALSTPDAYNPFSGGCVATTSYGDCSPSSRAAIDAIVFDMRRLSRTTLTMADFKLSRGDLFDLPAGPVGMAVGIEARRETQKDDRDANVDGTFTFTDMVTGETNLSNVSAVSPNPDTKGSREVFSTYIEFALPLVSPEMNIPLIYQLDMQLAGRYEHYSDFGSVAKPKVAAAWDVVPGVRVRGSYSEGFRAPNLEQTNATQYSRLASGVDYVRCEADLRAGRIASFSACSQNTSGASLLVAGNPDLEPEESTNSSYGLVLQPSFIPDRFGAFTFTIDRWRIEQEKIVGLLGAQTALALDYLNRVEGGSNPLVNRRDATPEDILLFEGTGLTPVGEVISINDRFINLQPQTVSGLDLGMNWSLRRTRFGTFIVNVNASKLDEFSRDPGDIVNALYAARADGTINAGTTLPETAQLVGQNGRPEWRVNASLTWRKGPIRAGISSQYISDFDQPGLLGASDEAWVVDSRQTINAYVDYEFPAETRLRLGVRDLTDQGPPLADNGYRGSVHSPWGRYWYVNASKSF